MATLALRCPWPRSWASPLANVSYHVAELRKLGAIKLTGTRPVRGAVEHFYTARWRTRLEAELID